MQCYKCQQKGIVKTDNKAFCNRCFCEVIEKRVRKEIRTCELLQKSDKVLIKDDGTEKGAVLKYLLEKIITDPTIKFVKKNYNKIIISWVLDDEAESYLKSMFENRSVSLLHSKKTVRPLIGVTQKEALAFASIKKLKFKPSKPFDTNIQEMIDKMDEKYPGTKFGILKTIRKTK